jgi:outer membrane protein
MKNLSIVLNVILLVAVIVLYALFFTSGNRNAGVSSRNDTTNLDLKIAYINSDTVLKYYDYLKVQKDQLESKTTKLKQDFRQRAVGLDSEIKAYQRNVSTMTLGQVRAVEEDLAKKQQNLQMYEQTLSQQMMEEEAKLSRELYDRVTTYLKEYGSEKGLQLVLKYDPTSDVLYGTSGIDITQDVIAGLNQAYETEKNGSTPKSDTTKAK